MRPLSFVASVGLHGIAVLLLILVPAHTEVAGTSAYKEIIQPQARKITWYDFRKPLPDVNALKKVGTSSKPRGTELSKQAIIATSQDPKSNEQFIWRPVPKIEIPKDLSVPNLIARINTAPPAPPPTTVRSVQQNNSPPEPQGDVNHAPESRGDTTLVAKPRKAFVPPPPATQQERSPAPTPMLETPPPDTSIAGSLKDSILALKLRKTFVPPPPETQPARLPVSATTLVTPPGTSMAGSSTMKSTLPEGLGAPALSTGSPPPPLHAPLAATAIAGNANVDVAIAGMHAAERLNAPLPEGTRPGRFSMAPTAGEAASGEGGGPGTLAIPDLTIRGDRSKSAEAANVDLRRKTILYEETVRSVPASTLSVPLRPSSRTIPSTIDARFQGRSVYTMVVPIENLPAYGGDWIIWFAEREPKTGDALSMRAPIPLRKLEPIDRPVSRLRVEWRLQIAAVIRQDGKIERISLLRKAGAATEQAVIQDLESWEFKPATRGGVPVNVDAVIEIPFILPAEVARREEP